MPKWPNVSKCIVYDTREWCFNFSRTNFNVHKSDVHLAVGNEGPPSLSSDNLTTTPRQLGNGATYEVAITVSKYE